MSDVIKNWVIKNKIGKIGFCDYWKVDKITLKLNICGVLAGDGRFVDVDKRDLWMVPNLKKVWVKFIESSKV